MTLERQVATAPRMLHPGDLACGGRGETFETLLGSCVAVVLTDPRRTAGAMCHIVHAAPAPAERRRDTAYAEPALARMFDLLRERGLQPRLCEAYVYGGGNMFPNQHAQQPIGERNVARVHEMLQDAGVRVLCDDVGGAAYRRLSWTVGPDAPTVTAVEL